jgi:hypothetical protein
MNRWVVLAVVLLPNCSGCLYYAYPTVTHVAPLTVPNPDGSVKAFRVDIDRTERQPKPPVAQYTLGEITVDERGQIPSQLEFAPATGVYNPLGLVEGGQHERTQYTMFVRLYRWKYCKQEVKAWEKGRELQWVPATDLLAQEKAIDDLLADPAAADRKNRSTWWELKDEKTPGLGLLPGLTSILHRKALDFASSEYQRLADSPAAAAPNMLAVRDRLRAKAHWLRVYADRPPSDAR